MIFICKVCEYGKISYLVLKFSTQLSRLKALLEKNLSLDPNALTQYYKLSGYAALMSGNNKAAIDHYSTISISKWMMIITIAIFMH